MFSLQIYEVSQHILSVWEDQDLCYIFTESAPRPIQSIRCDVRVLCVVCPLLETTLPGGLETSGRRECH